MFRTTLTLACAVVVAGLAWPAAAADCSGCKSIADKGEGYCNSCNLGKMFDVKLTSKKLYEALVGKSVEPDKLRCPSCKLASKTDGRCSPCRVGMAQGKAYDSPVAHKLAKGLPYTKDQAAHCGRCRDALASNGYCTGCQAGFVAHRVFKDKDSYDAALAAHKTLAKAAKLGRKCETCAVAMVTDGTCKQCQISFKEGEPTKK